ncbi:haloacid dehalogenase-like hydrolase [Myxococcota bacterium]|nr:haloacid dehalogenase-like hydrolase [Myxococcota bacterium]MBU1510501.1 haloacid dehalogenase-like hydrolase [Myxococcota bacterium]
MSHLLFTFAMMFSGATAPWEPVSLPSWSPESAARIGRWLTAVTTPGPLYIPRHARIAAMDLDGTLIVEKPDYFHGLVSKEFVRRKAGRDPALSTHPLVRAVLDGDEKTLLKNLKDFLLFSMEGETWETVRDFSVRIGRESVNPLFRRPYVELIYLPMIELIQALRARGFEVYIITTAQQDIVQAFLWDALRLEPRFVLGSGVVYDWDFDKGIGRRGRRFLEPLCHGSGKPVRIWDRIGAWPVLAAGNSTNDVDMLSSVNLSGYWTLSLAIEHDHPDEAIYGKPEFLEIAKRREWMVVSMKRDFRRLWGRPSPAVVPGPASRRLPAGWWILWLGTAAVAIGASVLVRRRQRR